MTVGDVALLVIATAVVILTVVGVITMVKFGRTLEVARTTMENNQRDTRPVLRRADTTLGLLNTNLGNITGVTNAARSVSSTAAGLVSVTAATLGGPVVRAASFAFGVRKALAARSAKAAKKAAKASAKRVGTRAGR
jgi:uncharacterized protein YoxC